MNFKEPEISETILRHLQGNASETEEILLKKWLKESPENTGVFEDYKKVWKETDLKEPEFTPDVDAAWRKVQLMANLQESPASSSSEKSKLIRLNLVWKVAAAFVLLTGLGYLAFQGLFVPEKFIEVTALNEIKQVSLPDGSVVALNINSSLRYPEGFSSESREVFLNGEAFFQVEKDPTKPFKVYGALSVTEVLGTSFNVRAYQEEGEEETTVFTGKVSFSEKTGKQKAVLTPGMAAKCNASGNVIESTDMEITNTLAWKSKSLTFKETDLAKVARDLEAYFGEKVIVTDQLKEQRFTGTFNNPEIEEVLNVIAISTDSKLTVQDSVFILANKATE